ncbi:hypothetical protein HK405_005427 [Cladochytrium tenue]|nr:hypothetical protein HK405_005427 [Cladochytrium tenue]
MYRDGQGVQRSDSEAASWFRKAAELGHAAAQSSLGLMYSTGKGVAYNFEEAVSWFRRAEAGGNDTARKILSGEEDWPLPEANV